MVSMDKAGSKPGQTDRIADETILKIAKEITVKFIEVGRITPTSFDISFANIYNSISSTVKKDRS